MSIRTFVNRLRIFSSISSLAGLLIVSAANFPAKADDATKNLPPPPHYREEGRPADPVPPGSDGVQLTPPPTGNPGAMQVGTPGSSDPRYGGVLYERNRIKRTVPLDPHGALDGKWDILYSYVNTAGGADEPGGSGIRTVYCDWDDNYLYLAMETPKPTDVRFDIDGKDDGWLRGADNLSLQVSPPASDGAAPTVTAQRFDTLQSRDRPVYAESPIPVSDIKAQAGMTPRGTYGVTVALPRPEAIGLLLKSGVGFGFRADSGLLPAQTGNVDIVSVRPMLRLALAESIPAQSDNGLQLSVSFQGGRQKAPEEGLRLTLQAKNASAKPMTLSRLFLRGSLGSINLLDAATYTGVILGPGQTLKRDLSSAIAPTTSPGTYVIAGGAEWEDGTAIASLASFDRLEPFSVDFKIDSKAIDIRSAAPVRKGGPSGVVRIGLVTTIAHGYSKRQVTVHLQLPDGWILDEIESSRTFTLSFPGDTRGQYLRVMVPKGTASGVYPITAVLDADGHTYTSSASVTVIGGSIPAKGR